MPHHLCPSWNFSACMLLCVLSNGYGLKLEPIWRGL